MNQKPTPERLAYRKRQLDELRKLLPDPPEKLPDLPEDSVLSQQHAAAAAHRIRKKPVPDQTHTKRTPAKLPDPWLFDNGLSLLYRFRLSAAKSRSSGAGCRLARISCEHTARQRVYFSLLA